MQFAWEGISQVWLGGLSKQSKIWNCSRTYCSKVRKKHCEIQDKVAKDWSAIEKAKENEDKKIAFNRDSWLDFEAEEDYF